jgi:hypothetical protein
MAQKSNGTSKNALPLKKYFGFSLPEHDQTGKNN